MPNGSITAIGTDRRPILLADDNPDDVLLIRLALEKSGFHNQLMVVRNGEQVLMYLNGEGPYANRARFPIPRLLLLDVTMPGMSGLDVLGWVRRQREWSHLPAFILSGCPDEAVARRAYQLGAQDFLIKPVEFNELVAAVRRVGEFWLRARTTDLQQRWAA